MTSTFSTQHLDVLSFAGTVDLDLVIRRYETTFALSRHRDAVHLDLPKGHVFVFDYGVMVSWGVSAAKKKQLQTELIRLVTDVHPARWDHFSFSLNASSEVTELMIVNDILTLPDYSDLELLALSHAFAQSSKLGMFESLAEQTINSHKYLTNTLAQTGKIPLGRIQLAKLRGALFQTKSDIVLSYNLLDVPEFFSHHPAMENQYHLIAKYLELTPRIQLLNMKLETIHELCDMLAVEQNYKNWSFLKWIIIILIAVEIVLLFVH